MKLQKLKVLAAIAMGSTALLITVGNGCSKRDAFNSLSSIAAPVNNTLGASTEEAIDPTVKMVSVVYAKQMLDQVTSCIGLQKPSDDTIRVYQQKSGAISLYGDAGSVTAPMMMATTSIVAEVCDDLIDQEERESGAGGKGAHVFLNWQMESQRLSTVLPYDRDMSDAISRIALSCWQKPPTIEEMNVLLDLAKSGAPTREKSALMICTAMLSSLKTLLN